MPDYFEQGFSVREPMWHGLGEVLPEYPGREEAMRLAGHDFVVVERPVQVVGNHSAIEAEGWKALVKSGSTTILNVVKQSYGVVQNDTLWDIVDALVDQPNVKYETAGVLKEGAVLWVLALLDEPYTVTGDNTQIYPYVCSSTTHDGSGACKAQATSIRVVCWNTYSAAAAQSKASGREFTFRHTKKVNERIEDAKLALSGVRASHEAFIQLSEELARVALRQDQVKLFIDNLIPMPPEALISERVMHNVDSARASIQAVLNGPTTADAHRQSGYGCFQAGIEYLDHVRAAKTVQSKFGRSILRQEPAKEKLVKLIHACAAA
jgi:phage/plasmid-like protein (TIGR03299 family)